MISGFNNPIATDAKRAQLIGFRVVIIDFTKKLSLNFLSNFATIITKIKDGNISEMVAISAPRIPAVLDQRK